MKLRSTFMASAIALISCFSLVSCENGKGYYNLAGFAQGGTWQVTLNVDEQVSASAEELKSGIDSILLDIDNTLSGYNKSSLLSRFNAGDTIQTNEMFRDIYSRSVTFWKETDGAVDVAAAPLFDIWGFGFTTDSLPSPEKVKDLVSRCGMYRLAASMDEAVLPDGRLSGGMLLRKESDRSSDASSATEAGADLPELNYNAVAQGYSCDLIASYLHEAGVTDMLINVGGEIYVNGMNPSGKGWVLGIDRPEDGSQVAGEKVEAVFSTDGGSYGIVTSGNYRKFYIKDGQKYAHSIDPRTGYPVTHHLLSATVISPDATSADAYATYCMVTGLENAIRFITSRDDLEGCLIYEEAGEMKTWNSPGITLR